MKAAVEREGGPFALFGGEPLLVPEEDLEALVVGARAFWIERSSDQRHADQR